MHRRVLLPSEQAHLDNHRGRQSNRKEYPKAEVYMDRGEEGVTIQEGAGNITEHGLAARCT